MCLLSQHDEPWSAGQQRELQFILAVTCEPWLLNWSNWTCLFHQVFQQPRFASIQERYLLCLFMFMCTLQCKLYLAHCITEVKITFSACVSKETGKGLTCLALYKGILGLLVKWGPSRCLHLSLPFLVTHMLCVLLFHSHSCTLDSMEERNRCSFFQKAAGRSL